MLVCNSYWSQCLSVRLLREELQLLQEQGSYVGEVVRAMDKKKVLVKVISTSSPAPPLLFCERDGVELIF